MMVSPALFVLKRWPMIVYTRIKGSILIELSGVLHTSPNYLLGMEDYEEDLLEIITVYKNLKGSKTKQIALEQMKLLATMSSEL